MAVFDYEWLDDAEPSSDRVSQYTMARVRIEAGGQIVSSLYDRYLKDNRDEVFVPLAHVAEWMAANWWHLWYEPADVSGEQRPGFVARHDLAEAGNGFVLPRVTFIPVGDRVRVRARRWSPMHAPLEFRAECDVMLDRDDLEQEFRSLIGDVIERLRAKGTPLESMESEWRTINRSIRRNESSAKPPRSWDLIRSTSMRKRLIGLRGLGISSIRLFAKILSAPPRNTRWMRSGIGRNAAWNRRNRARAGRVGGPSGRPRGAREPAVTCRGSADTKTLVRFVRNWPPSRAHLSSSGVAKWGYQSPAPRIHGVVASESPSCVVVRKPEPGKRFLVARALGDYVGREEPAPAVLASLDTARQARTRAFAAEFLAPAAWLRNQVGSAESVDGEAVDEFAAELGVSSWVVHHQIQNHRIAEIANPVWPSG